MSLSKLVRVDVSINFTDYIAKRVGELVSENKKVVVIFPNLRPLRFVEKKLPPDDVLNAEFYSMPDFVKSGIVRFSYNPPIFQDEVDRLLFILGILKKNSLKKDGSLYKKLGGEDSLVFPWVKRLSSLFSEIDKQLIESVKDFQYFEETVEEAKAILENLESLYKDYCSEKNRLNITYGGDVYKRFLELITGSKRFIEENKGRVFLFCGFAYLARSEKEIISFFKDNFETEIYFHSDTERRHFITENYFNVYGIYDSWVKGDFWGGECLSVSKGKGKPEVEFFESYDIHSQVRQVSEKLKEIVERNKLCGRLNLPEAIGIILPDSKSLLPLLFYFPELCNSKVNKNITLSFPFSKTGMGVFIDTVFKIILEMKKGESKKIYVPFLIKLLKSEVFSLLKIEARVSIDTVISYLLEKNIVFIDFLNEDFLIEEPHIKDYLFHIYLKLIKPFYEAESLELFLKAFEGFYSLIDKSRLKMERFKYERIVFEQFYTQVVLRLESLKKSKFAKNINFNPRFFYSLISILAKAVSIPFEGNPLKGVQIMGMLEARSLSFDHFFILDVNEGVVPSAEKIDPLMPESLKIELGLSGFKEREMLFRYNFFRLLDSSKKAYIFYQSGHTTYEKKIRSRFVEQLIFEKEVEQKALNGEMGTNFVRKGTISFKGKNKSEGIKKSDWIQKEFENFFDNKNKISATFLDDYLTCPYFFYLKRIARIGDRNKLDESQRADIVGTLVHLVLEKGFSKFKGELLDNNKLSSIRKVVIDELTGFISSFKFSKFVVNGNEVETIEGIAEYLKFLDKTRKEILKTVSVFRLNEFFEFMKRRIAEQEITLVDFEKRVGAKVGLVNGVSCYLYGIIDRIDRVTEKKSLDSYFKIIDYKTGKYAKTPPSKFWNIKEVIGNMKSSNVFNRKDIELIKEHINSIQLPFYIYLYKQNQNDCTLPVKSALYMLGKSGDSIESVFSINDMFKDDFCQFFETVLRGISFHMLKSEFVYATPGKACTYCYYRHFCKFSI